MIQRLICKLMGHKPHKLENRWAWATPRPRILMSMRFCGRCDQDMPVDFTVLCP